MTGAAGSVTSVSGSWIVPAVTSPTSSGSLFTSRSGLNPGSMLTSGTNLAPGFHSNHRPAPTTEYYAAFWLGIDGLVSNTVEQTGILAEVSGTTASYYAVYEFYPSPLVALSTSSYPVSSGDAISASVTCVGSTFTITIADATSPHIWSYSTTGTVTNAKEESAEWIAEAPSSSSGILPLANFGTVTFSGCTATIGANANEPISFYQPSTITTSVVYEMTMYNYPRANEVMALPTSLTTSGTGFSVAWESAGP